MKLIMLVVLSLFVCCGTKATIAGDIYGYVYDTNDKGLAGVNISTKENDKVYSGGTSGSGHYCLSLGVGTYTIRYQKEGYQTQTNDVSLLKNETKSLELVVMAVSR